MAAFETVEVPFKMIGNRRCLTEHQVDSDPEFAAFVERFRHCFEHDEQLEVYALIEDMELR